MVRVSSTSRSQVLESDTALSDDLWTVFFKIQSSIKYTVRNLLTRTRPFCSSTRTVYPTYRESIGFNHSWWYDNNYCLLRGYDRNVLFWKGFGSLLHYLYCLKRVFSQFINFSYQTLTKISLILILTGLCIYLSEEAWHKDCYIEYNI